MKNKFNKDTYVSNANEIMQENRSKVLSFYNEYSNDGAYLAGLNEYLEAKDN
jgi:hypothetical protein